MIEHLHRLASSLEKVLGKRLSDITSAQIPFESGFAANLALTETWCKLLALRRLLKANGMQLHHENLSY